MATGSADPDHYLARLGLALNGRSAMATAPVVATDRLITPGFVSAPDAPRSAISWGAIIGGAFAAASVSVILVALGSGLGLASVSPWPNSGVSVTAVKAMTIIWLIVVQWLSAGIGGYLTGRLRTQWTNSHAHETYFRDSAHGFVTWAVATVLVAVVLSSAISSLVGGMTRSAATIAGGAAQGGAQAAGTMAAGTEAPGAAANPSVYFVDTMFRSDTLNANATDQDVKGETGRIMTRALRDGNLSTPDRTYLAKLVAARTGLSQADAEKRVDDVYAQAREAELKAKQAADAARKAGAQLALFTALSMLIGAFIAAAAAALGGAHRDEGWGYPPI
jgi:hypothetical protein